MAVESRAELLPLERVNAVGTTWMGQEYVRRLREDLAQLRDDCDGPARKDDWVSDIVFVGEDLPGEVYFEIILAAIDEAGDDDDDDLLWCIGDGPVDHLVDRDTSFWLGPWGQRFHVGRAMNANVDRMFRVMQRYYAETLQMDCGWWSDEFGERPV